MVKDNGEISAAVVVGGRAFRRGWGWNRNVCRRVLDMGMWGIHAEAKRGLRRGEDRGHDSNTVWRPLVCLVAALVLGMIGCVSAIG